MSYSDLDRALIALAAVAVGRSAPRKERTQSAHREVMFVASNTAWAHNAFSRMRVILDKRFGAKFAGQQFGTTASKKTCTCAIITVYHADNTTTRILFRTYSRNPADNVDPALDPRPIILDPGLIVPNLQEPPKRSNP